MARIRFAALGAALMIASAAAGAQAPLDTRPAAEGRGGRGHGARDQGRAGKALLKGIKLSDSQKTQIKQIRTKYRDQFQVVTRVCDSSVTRVRHSSYGPTSQPALAWASE